jgi:hypothetical protein
MEKWSMYLENHQMQRQRTNNPTVSLNWATPQIPAAEMVTESGYRAANLSWS